VKYGQLPSHKECLSAHASFHREAGKVAQLINQKKYVEAEAALGVGTPYTSASMMTAVAINRIKKEAAL
jgi:methyl-accepting chemotaxis protein